MKLGFVSAILPDLSLEEVVRFASSEGFACVELMCWPKGRAERRYAGVTHVDVEGFDRAAADRVTQIMQTAGVAISGLGYYPNPLAPDQSEAEVYIGHLEKVIRAAEDHGRRIGIENCPMLFTDDEWPGGKNLAHCPAVWRRMFDQIPSASFGLNYDPSHLVWQQIDYVAPLYEFADRIFHVHAKDAKVNRRQLDDVGVLATPLRWHTPKLPGLGEVAWGKLFSALTDIGYQGPVCIEVEDRAYEPELELRKRALRQSRTFLSQYVVGSEERGG